jgi:hypothetical protein
MKDIAEFRKNNLHECQTEEPEKTEGVEIYEGPPLTDF